MQHIYLLSLPISIYDYGKLEAMLCGSGVPRLDWTGRLGSIEFHRSVAYGSSIFSYNYKYPSIKMYLTSHSLGQWVLWKQKYDASMFLINNVLPDIWSPNFFALPYSWAGQKHLYIGKCELIKETTHYIAPKLGFKFQFGFNVNFEININKRTTQLVQQFRLKWWDGLNTGLSSW